MSRNDDYLITMNAKTSIEMDSTPCTSYTTEPNFTPETLFQKGTFKWGWQFLKNVNQWEKNPLFVEFPSTRIA